MIVKKKECIKMKISCATEILNEAINLVGRTVSTRTPLPILECILVTAFPDGTVRLMANDLEMGIETTPLAAEVETPGAVALEARLFSEIVRKMPGDTIQIEVNENYETLCKSGKARFKIMGLSGEEFPTMPEFSRTGGYTLPTKLLREMVKQTIFSVAVEGIKPILTGELIEYKDDALRMVAVDGHRISYRAASQEDMESITKDDDAPLSVVVPAKALHELSRILPVETDEKVCCFFTDKRVVFDVAERFTFTSRLLEGEFIRYDQIFNEDFTTSVVISRADLLTALERAVLIARENKKTPVRMDISGTEVSIASQTETGNVHDEVMASVIGNELSISFNPKFLIDALRAIDEGQVSLRFTTNLSPCIIRGVENEHSKYLILPLRSAKAWLRKYR